MVEKYHSYVDDPSRDVDYKTRTDTTYIPIKCSECGWKGWDVHKYRETAEMDKNTDHENAGDCGLLNP